MDRFGFIVTRCVNKPYNDFLWKECIMCIRKVYPCVKIVIIDDHSEISVDESALDVNISVVNSTYKKDAVNCYLTYIFIPKDIFIML